PDPATMTAADRADLDRRIDAAGKANKQVSAQDDEYPIRVGTAWEHGNYQGVSLTFQSKEGCNRYGQVYKYPQLPYGWNDIISSFVGEQNCQALLYEHTYFGGSYTQRFFKLEWLGKMNDKTSSVQLFTKD
ncbi:peptidase inhibitor family I36 protein, partial [Streptosporangium sp. NPDC051023]|uniref:peptidase inhibitor family I36 protein n=1 Tax=Streptosporangium sp. NPDC051023 TaxID=3155410 RepID=UPI00344B2F8D